MHPIAPYARTAFATGWAASGGPMTEKVKAACIAAVGHAIEHADDPHIIEATLQLGHLEGVWATIYDRRADLYATQGDALFAAWQDLVDGLDWAEVIQAARQQFGLRESANDQAQKNENTDHAVEIIAAIILLLLQRRVGTPQWQALRSAVIGALQQGLAEGEAGSLAILASYRNPDGSFDFQAAADDALAQTSYELDLLGGADIWLSRLVTDLSYGIARAILRMAKADASLNDITLSLLDGTAFKRVIGWFVDNVVHLSITQGILGFFRRNAVSQVWFVTAGDDKVCPDCDAAEAGSPYDLNDAPQPPLHPNCRCSVYTTEDLPSVSVDGYS